MFVVKYLDGVEFMIDKIKFICEQQSLPCRIFLEAREEGYYAAHIYTKQEFEVPRVNWDTEKIKVSIEIQITTIAGSHSKIAAQILRREEKKSKRGGYKMAVELQK